MNLIKATIATAAITVCCLGNEYPAKAAPAWMTFTAKDHCEYLALGVPSGEAMQMALNDNNHWRNEIKRSYAISREATIKAYAYTMLRTCPDEMDKWGDESKSKQAAEQQQAQSEFRQFYRSTSTLGYQ